MAFPNDLSNVVVIKIHPAIGIARVSKNDDHFVHSSTPQTGYKSNGLMKRQAVQFRLFAYGENHTGLGELTADVLTQLGLDAVWSAKVANRKIAALENEPLSSMTHVIAAEASSNDANQGQLTGHLADFAEGADIPLGQIAPGGLFIPPKAGVFRKTPGLAVPPYPNFTNEIADTTSDGVISCELCGAAEIPPILPACVVVAPGDYSPDVDPPAGDPNESLLARLRQDITTPGAGGAGTLHNQTARELDEAALRPCTADFAPGFETSFDGGEVSSIPTVFYRPGVDDHIEPHELRVRYRTPATASGAVPGQLTSGLCSPWQTDFTACTGYWSEHIPVRAFLDENDQVGINVYRKVYGNHSQFAPRLSSGDDYERHQDKIGVVRLRNGRQVETEREPGDDIG